MKVNQTTQHKTKELETVLKKKKYYYNNKKS